MKKGIWILMLLISLAMISVGCSGDEGGAPQGNDMQNEDLENDLDLGDGAGDSAYGNDEDNEDEDDIYSGSRPMPDVIEEVDDPYERMREGLEEFVEYVNRPYDIDAEYYGAESAKRFGFDDGSMQLYVFSPGSDGLKRLYETGMLVAEGRSVGTPVEFHDNIAMELDVDNEELANKIIELFKSL